MELLENETRAQIYKERTARVREYCKYMKNDSMINDWIEHPGNLLYRHFEIQSIFRIVDFSFPKNPSINKVLSTNRVKVHKSSLWGIWERLSQFYIDLYIYLVQGGLVIRPYADFLSGLIPVEKSLRSTKFFKQCQLFLISSHCPLKFSFLFMGL